MRESDIQNASRKILSSYGSYARVNVGKTWIGKSYKLTAGQKFVAEHGDVLIKKARRFTTGVPPGTPDLVGFTNITITSDMVGKTLPIFTGIEFKTETGRIRPEQEHMIKFLLSKGCLAGVARSPAEAVRIVKHD